MDPPEFTPAMADAFDLRLRALAGPALGDRWVPFHTVTCEQELFLTCKQAAMRFLSQQLDAPISSKLKALLALTIASDLWLGEDLDDWPNGAVCSFRTTCSDEHKELQLRPQLIICSIKNEERTTISIHDRARLLDDGHHEIVVIELRCKALGHVEQL